MGLAHMLSLPGTCPRSQPSVPRFHVDVLSFVDTPLADVPEPVGLTLAEAATSLAELAASPRFTGLSVTGINPDHLPDTAALPRFERALTQALTGG